jgi:hypothetical protein
VRGRPLWPRGGTVARVERVRLDPARLDVLVALGLATVLMLQIWLSDHIDGTVVDVVGGLCLTLPLAVRRRAPLAVAVVFATAAALDAILGGPPRRGSSTASRRRSRRSPRA